MTQAAASKNIRQQFADTMLEVGQSDPTLVVVVGDISHFNLQPFAKACPGRYYNIGICEPAMVSVGAGLSKVGFRPVIHTIAPFLIERSFEQFKLDFCYQKLSGNVVTVGSAFDYANLGSTHHCYGDFALLKTLDGAQITYPSTPLEFDTLFRQAYQNEFLTFYRVPGKAHDVAFDKADIKLGKGIRVAEGKDVTIVVTGPQLTNAMKARELLKASGWNAEVIYIHTIRPLDADLISASVKKTRRVLVVEEHMRSGGLGDDVLRLVNGLGSIAYSSLSIPDRFIHDYGRYEDHCRKLGLTAEGITERVLQSFTR